MNKIYTEKIAEMATNIVIEAIRSGELKADVDSVNKYFDAIYHHISETVVPREVVFKWASS